MSLKNEWNKYDSFQMLDTGDEVFKKYLVKLDDGKELVACYVFDRFIDIDNSLVIDNKVKAYMEIDDVTAH